MLIAVDTGGTKTLVATFAADGTINEQVRFPTPTAQHEYINQLQATIKHLIGNRKLTAIVVALPSMIKDGVAVWCPNIGWKDFDIRVPLAIYFPKVPVLIENDANLGGLGETRMMSPNPTSSLYVTISTGIGTGFIKHGHIDNSLRLSEGGQMMIEFDGKIRNWESFASGRAINRTYNKFAHDITSKRTWNQIADRISRGFLVIIPLVQPEMIIIGGSIGTYYERYGVHLGNLLREKLPRHIACPVFRQALNPELAVIYGCYYYALDELADFKN